jgi:hypothetical protein
MTESAGDSVRQGLYTAWDSLNTAQGAHFVRIRPLTPTVTLGFDDLMHPRYMGELYAALPGVLSAYKYGAAGDWPNVYPLQRPGGRTYLFRAAGGDCPAGCTINEYWYYRFSWGKPEFVGYWDPSLDPTPDWWTEAKANREHFPQW